MRNQQKSAIEEMKSKKDNRRNDKDSGGRKFRNTNRERTTSSEPFEKKSYSKKFVKKKSSASEDADSSTKNKNQKPFENKEGQGFRAKKKPILKSNPRFGAKKEYTNRFSGKKKYDTKPVRSAEDNPEEVRLNKYIASSGLCSRREADEFIILGLISVNNTIVTELGAKINPYTDVVKYNGSKISSEKKVYVLLNKPKDFVTTVDDPQGRKTVLDLVKNACDERIYPVGRLDRNTTGVLLLTNDGELTKRLTHPKFKHKKIYHVFLDKELTRADMEALALGIDLDDGFINTDQIHYVDQSDKKQIGVEIHSGRNRIIKRMFQHLGYNVIKLDRVYFAGLTKKGLSRGQWRHLNEKEVHLLIRGNLS